MNHCAPARQGLTSAVMEMIQALKVDGKAGDDHGGLIQFYEKMAKVEVRA